MKSMRNILDEAQAHGRAVGHFNVSDLVLLRGVVAAARELNVPVIVGASDGERRFMGIRQIAALVKSLREESDSPIFLNSDHTHSLADAMEAARCGFDSVVFDRSALPFEENIRETAEAVKALKAINSSILVEGEIGDIGTGSEVRDTAPDLSRGLSSPEDARRFVAATHVDVLAPAVGNMHGMLKSMVEGSARKHLDIERISQIKQSAQVPLTLHGGSGTDDNDFRKAIAAGINIVHINTELRVAWRRGLEDSLRQQPQEVVPYKLLEPALDDIKQVVLSRLRLFQGK